VVGKFGNFAIIWRMAKLVVVLMVHKDGMPTIPMISAPDA